MILAAGSQEVSAAKPRSRLPLWEFVNIAKCPLTRSGHSAYTDRKHAITPALLVSLEIAEQPDGRGYPLSRAFRRAAPARAKNALKDR